MIRNIWIVNPYGTLPSEGWRDYRSFMLANALANRGHRVLWWISDFEHRSKKRRADAVFRDPLLPANVKVVAVKSRSYDRNISFGRIAYEKSFGDGFAALAPGQVAPDMVVLADPSLFYSAQVQEFVDRIGCKLVPSIYAQCDVGLCSYAPESTVSMPVKVYDYLAAGLYVYSSLETEIADHLRVNRCGEMYRAGSAQSLFALIEKTLSDRGALADGKKRAAMLGREFDSVAQHDKMAGFLLDLCEE